MQRQNSFGRSRKNGDGLSRFGDTGSSKSFFLPDERERNSRVSSDEAADEAAAEIANGGSLLERKESAARHAAPAPSGLTRAMSFRQGRERALSMPDLSVYGVMTPWADKEVAHKGDGPGLKETSHATKEKDGRGNKYVNQYLIIHKIGQTSWSKVKLCLNTTDFSPYVIKEVRKSHLCGAAEGGPGSAGSSTVSAEARIKKEVAIIKKLDHPKIVAFHEVINDSAGDKLYFVMEYLAKGPVQTTSSQSGLAAVPLELAWMYFRDIVLGLEYLHARGVVHGDIKPENVLVSLTGEAKITDFGVSVASAGGARGGVAQAKSSAQDLLAGVGMVGSPVFNAPELLQPGWKEKVRPAVDVWALGISLYMMLSGTSPFQGNTLLALTEAICDARLRFPPPPNTGVATPFGERVRDLIARMLEPDPAKRVTMAEVRQHAWVTRGAQHPLAQPFAIGDSNDVEVTEAEIADSMREMPKLSLGVMVKLKITIGRRAAEKRAAAAARLRRRRRRSLEVEAEAEAVWARQDEPGGDGR